MVSCRYSPVHCDIRSHTDVLVLQVDDGKETVRDRCGVKLMRQFITVQATFRPTILALPLPVLSTLPGPIASLPFAARKELGSDDPRQQTEGKGAKPVKEVWTLLEYLMAAAPCPGVWTEEVAQTAVLAVLDAVDRRSPLPAETAPAAVANCLAYILGWAPGGLLGEQRAKCEAVQDRDDAFAAIESLGQVETNVSVAIDSEVREQRCANDRFSSA